MKREGTNRLHYLMLVPGVGVILFFIATTVLVTVARSFGLFSISLDLLNAQVAHRDF